MLTQLVSPSIFQRLRSLRQGLLGRDIRARIATKGAARIIDLGLGALIVAVLCILVLVRPVDHDESQYVAATVLAHKLLPYRDFDYLQTPLQPLLLAPVVRALPIAPLVLLRLCNAVMGGFAAWMLGRLITERTQSKAWGRVSIILLLASDPFQFAVSTARNDMLPFLCLCACLQLLLHLERSSYHRAILVSTGLGFIMAIGAAAKISYALPAAAIPLAIATGGERRSVVSLLLGYAFGAALVGFLCFWIVVASPGRAWFDMLIFPAQAPTEWYRAHGDGIWLSLPGRSFTFLKFFVIGPAPVLLAAMLSHPGNQVDPTPLFPRQCKWLLAAGTLAALLPAPLWRQYLLILYPPLFVLGVPSLASAWQGRWWQGLTMVSSAIGTVLPVVLLISALVFGAPLLVLERDAAALSLELRRLRIQKPIASISPEFVTDAGGDPDPRLAAGPFLFRTTDSLGHETDLIGVDQNDAVARFRSSPPGAILSGGDAMTAGSPALDARMADIARQTGFSVPVSLPQGLMLWVRPVPASSHRKPRRSASRQ